MKRMIAGLAAGLLLAALCGCGGTPNEAPESTSAVETTLEQELTTEQAFVYAKKEMPKGWTIEEKYGTSSYLEATYGKGENPPRLSVSVFHYDDTHGYGKARALADAVHGREKKSSKIQTRKINGTDFYYLSFPSPNDAKLLRYEFYGQTEPNEENQYDFFMIVLDNLTDAKQYAALEEVLDCIDFTESEAQ